MIESPPIDPPRDGELAPPGEAERVAEYAKLRGEALSLPWAAERLGIGVARVEALVRAGELLAVPGPWPMRQAHRSGDGVFVPAWQLDPDAAEPYPGLADVLAAAADARWTSLALHRFMTAPVGSDRSAPADWLRAGDVERVVALIRGEPRRADPGPAPARPRRALRRLHLHHRRVAV